MAPTATGREALSDIARTIGEGLRWASRRMPLVSSVTPGIDFLRGRAMTRAVALLDPGRHPWRYGCAIGLRGGFATSILDAVVLVVKGQLNGPQITDLAAVAPALIGIEAGLIVSGYAILGRYLGLRPTRAASAARA